MLPSFVRIRKYPEKLNRSPSILVLWTRGEREVHLHLEGPRRGDLGGETIKPKEARKLARALLRAANEAEGRPVPRLLMEDDKPDQSSGH